MSRVVRVATRVKQVLQSSVMADVIRQERMHVGEVQEKAGLKWWG